MVRLRHFSLVVGGVAGILSVFLVIGYKRDPLLAALYCFWWCHFTFAGMLGMRERLSTYRTPKLLALSILASAITTTVLPFAYLIGTS